MNMSITMLDDPVEDSPAAANAAYRRGVADGGTIVFNAVMNHPSNKGRGTDLFLELQQAADDALAVKIIPVHPDEQPLWEHLIDTAYWEADARRKGYGPFAGAPREEIEAFKQAVRSMLAKKLPAPDTENMELRRLLCEVVKAMSIGEGDDPAAPMSYFAKVPDMVYQARERVIGTLKTLGQIVHDMTVANQAAWIEWRHGKGAEAAMGWVQNGLVGPGHIPDETAPYGQEAQAWFDANKADPFPTCFCGRPSSTLWMGQGFCSEAHYRQVRDAHPAGVTA